MKTTIPAIMPPNIRFAYSFAIVVYSVLAFMEFGYIIPNFTAAPSYLIAYLVIRFLLALGQLPVHASILIPARYLPEAADKVTKFLGKGSLEQGVEKFYTLINVCNVAITVFIVFGAIVLIKVGDAPLLFYRILEVISLCILFGVLMLRIRAVITGKVRQMFYLAWAT